MDIYILFHTHSDGIKFEKKVKALNLSCTLMPVPRRFSSSCGICGKMIFNESIDKKLFAEVDKVYFDDGTLFLENN